MQFKYSQQDRVHLQALLYFKQATCSYFSLSLPCLSFYPSSLLPLFPSFLLLNH